MADISKLLNLGGAIADRHSTLPGQKPKKAALPSAPEPDDFQKAGNQLAKSGQSPAGQIFMQNNPFKR